jgi:BlaI family transcriptional regulator, penicillinase repressor
MVAPRRKRRSSLTPLELEIMQVLWKSGPGNVQAVQERLNEGVAKGTNPDSKLAYTTVQTMLNILQRKGKVKRTLRGRAYEYRAAVSEDKATSHALHDLVDRMFGGSAEQLVMSLVKSRQADPERIVKLLRQLADQERSDADA